MGWTYTHKPQGQTIRDFLESELWSSDKFKVLECTVVKMKTAYLAIETTRDNKREVFAAVCLLNYAPKDYHNFGYKDMDESMGPCEAECPEKILNLLTPAESKWAIEWRERCRQNIARAKEVKDRLKPGTVIKFEKPLTFTNGWELDVFTVQDLKKNLFETKSGYIVKIKYDALLYRKWEILKTA